jgi:zinc/manganese transport system permease protein
MMGALIFAMTRRRDNEIPQEAIIGIVYAVATAAAILAVARQPEGAEHIKAILVGSVLTVTPMTVLKTAVLYTAIGVLHWLWRKPIWAITNDADAARRGGISLRLWDFLFYGSFAFVVTSSVHIVGVLLVFALRAERGQRQLSSGLPTSRRLTFGWIFGVVVCVAGIVILRVDPLLPAPIVGSFGAALLGTGARQ